METKIQSLNLNLIKSLHWALHNSATLMPQVRGQTFRIRLTSKQELRQIVVNVNGEKIKFTQQSIESGSVYARRALRGEEITWGIRDNGKWIYVDSKTIKVPNDIKLK